MERLARDRSKLRKPFNVMVSKAILILWIGVVAADLPEEGGNLQSRRLLTHVPKNLDLLTSAWKLSKHRGEFG